MMFGKKNSIEAGEAELEQVLRNFRESVHAWSEAQYGRPRSVAPVAVHHTWRMAAAWALGCVLAVGGLSAGVYERYHQKETAKDAERQGPQQQKVVTVAPTAEASNKAAVSDEPVEQIAQIDASEPDANLLAQVDSDVSRQVSSAMEPLAQLMENYSSQ